MTDRIDNLDPVIVAVTHEEFEALWQAYLKIGAQMHDVGDEIRLIDVEETVIARFRLPRNTTQ